MSNQQFTAKQIDQSYRGPNGLRARKPFIVSNIIIGSLITIFAGSVYAYSISAVKQDDFSDLEDLLPPLSQRQGIQSIEDELRLQAESELLNAKASPLQNSTSSPSALSRGIPGSTSSESSISRTSRLGGWLPSRLSSVPWLVSHGVVERETGNVIVWGAPNVDNIGRVAGTNRGPKLV